MTNTSRWLKTILITNCLCLFIIKGKGQDTTDILTLLDTSVQEKTEYVQATFKTTRLINGHTIETLGKKVLDVKISHRFGKLNGGLYQLFGLDNATMRMGVDYGLSNNVLIGVGRSSYEKTYDGYIKIKLLKQSIGKRNNPFSIAYIATMAINTLKFADPTRKNLSTSRYYYTHQFLIARKFSEGFSFQVMPSYIHQNLVPLVSDHNDMFAIGFGGRQKISKRVCFTAEYYYQLPGTKLKGRTNSFSTGIDIETGGHVFQFHFTNSQGMTERSFISNTTGKWGKGDIFFGFNISRVFNVGKH